MLTSPMSFVLSYRRSIYIVFDVQPLSRSRSVLTSPPSSDLLTSYSIEEPFQSASWNCATGPSYRRVFHAWKATWLTLQSDLPHDRCDSTSNIASITSLNGFCSAGRQRSRHTLASRGSMTVGLGQAAVPLHNILQTLECVPHEIVSAKHLRCHRTKSYQRAHLHVVFYLTGRFMLMSSLEYLSTSP